MGAAGNSPRRFTHLTLEARKSFAFGVLFRAAATSAAIDITGATVRLVLAQPLYQGGAVLVDQDATILDAGNGETQFELQAADLDLADGEYPFVVTLVNAAGYSTPAIKGEVEIVGNADPDVSNVYAGVNPATQISAYLEDGVTITVEVEAVGVNGSDGSDGASAYAIALANGFVGTQAQWLASLKGADGADGADGQVVAVVAGDGVAVDATDPSAPVVSVDTPALLLENGAAVPGGTPIGTLIFEKGA